MKTSKVRPTLGWLHKLQEVGQPITDLARREEDTIKAMAEAEAAHRLHMRAMRKTLKRLAKDAARDVASLGWTSEEVAEAKRKATGHVAIPSHVKGEKGTMGASPWCLSCFADVTDPVHVPA